MATPAKITPLIYDEQHHEHAPAPAGSVLDPVLVPVSTAPGNTLTVDAEGVYVPSTEAPVVVSSDQGNAIVKGSDGGALLKFDTDSGVLDSDNGTVSVNVPAMVDSTDDNFLGVSSSGKLRVDGNSILSNGDTNLLTINPTDKKVTLTKEAVIAALERASHDEGNLIVPGTDGGCYLSVEKLLGKDNDILHGDDAGKLVADLSLRYNLGTGKLDVIGYDGSTVVSSVTVPTSTSSLRSAYLADGKPSASGEDVTGDYFITIAMQYDGLYDSGASLKFRTHKSAASEVEFEYTVDEEHSGVWPSSIKASFVGDNKVAEVSQERATTIVFSDGSILSITWTGISGTRISGTATFTPAVGIESGSYIRMVYLLDNGDVADVYVDVTSLVDVYVQGNGITISGNTVSVKAKSSGGITVDSSGVAVDTSWLHVQVSNQIPLSDAVDSTSSTTAASSNAVKTAYDAAMEAQNIANDALSSATPDGITISRNSDDKLVAKDIAVNGEASDLVSKRGLFNFLIVNDPAPDLNNFTTQGVYFFYSASAGAGSNFPVSQGGILVVYSSSNQYTKHVYYAITSARTLTRNGSVAGWSAWSDYLRSTGVGDGITVNNGVISVPEYEGATDSSAATSGLVPPATSGQRNLYLSGDGEWTNPRPSAGNGISIVDNTVSVKPKTNGGISVDSSGVAISVGDGISISDAGAIIAKLQQDGGLAIKHDTGEIYVDFSLLPADMLREIVLSMVQEGGGLSVDENGQLYVDFASMPEELLRAIVLSMVQEGGGLVVDEKGQIYVDFSSMPTDKFEAMLKSIRVPVWLSAPLTIYVATTGSDTLDEGRGLTEDKPFATLQAAVNYVADTYNLSKYNVTIKLAAGDYGRNSITLPSYTASTGEVYIQGASPSAPESTKIGRVNLAYSNNYHLVDLACKPADINVATASVVPSAGVIYLQNVVIDISETTMSNNANLMGISVSLNGTVYINATNNGVPNGVKIKVSDTFSQPNIILSAAGGIISAYADIEIDGTATLVSCFASVRQLGKIQFLKSASPNPGRTAIVKLADGANITGKRYQADLNGIIDVSGGGPEFFPGTIAGTVSNGGQYA